FERELPAQCDGGPPDGLEQRPRPAVVVRPRLLRPRLGPAGGELRVEQLGPYPPQLRLRVGGRPRGPPLLRRQHLRRLLLPRRRLAQASGQRSDLLTQGVRLGTQPVELVTRLLRLHLGHRTLVLGSRGPVLGRRQALRDRGVLLVQPEGLDRASDQRLPPIWATEVRQCGHLHGIRGGRSLAVAYCRTELTSGVEHPRADPLAEQ